jgi:hypothetical protein
MRGFSMQQAMSWYLVITLSIVGAYDLYAIIFVGGNSTVSFEIYSLGKRFPTLYLFIGLLIGHIVFPLHVVDNGNPPIPSVGNGEKK